MGKRAEALLESILAIAANNGGVALIEVWRCPRCKQQTFAIHALRETLACGNCKHHVASGLPRYQKFADLFVEQR